MPHEGVPVRKIDQLIVGAILATAVGGLLQILSIGSIDFPLLVATFSFAAAVPLLTGEILMIEQERWNEGYPRPWYGYVTYYGGILGGLVGITAFLFHLHCLAGYLFMLSSVASILLVAHHDGLCKQGATPPR